MLPLALDHMLRPIPLGLSGALTTTDGIAPYAGSRVPGPLTAATGGAGTPISAGPHREDVEDSLVGSDAPAGDIVSLPFEVGAEFYRLQRVDADRRQSFNEMPLTPEQAAAVLERAAEQHRSNDRLLPILQLAMRQLAGIHDNGIFLVLRLWPDTRAEKVAAPPPRAAAPRPAMPVPAPAAVAEAMMPVARAAVLREAAVLGVPFCEECARAAEERRAADAAS
jgi:hypothetical protein